MIAREELDSFVEDMLLKQSKHDPEKGDMYKTESLAFLMNMLDQEVVELKCAIIHLLQAPEGLDQDQREAVRHECADVANFAAFIHTHM